MKFAILLLKTAAIIGLSLGLAQQNTASAANVEFIENVSIMERLQIDEHHLRLTISLGTRQETLLLSESPTFHQLKIIDQNGRPTASATKAYAGTIEKLANSWARVTITGQEVEGVLDTGFERLFFTSQASATAARRNIRRQITPIDKIVFAPTGRRTVREVVEIPVGTDLSNASEGVTRVAKIAIVVDSFYDEALGGRGLTEAISTINSVDGLYQQEFGLALKVETAIIVTDSETIGLASTSLEDNLARFREYRVTAPELAPELALVHLFTGVRTEDESVGLAYIDSACREDGYDVSLSTPFEFPVLLTAHEIGHNLGAEHDDDTVLCSLSDELLMHSSISDLTTNKFSVCSDNVINAHLDNGACYFAAIDLSLTLTRDDETGIIAIVTNNDTELAFPSANLIIRLKNASIAAAPASCNIMTVNELNCIIPTTLPQDSQILEFILRYDDTADNTIDATLEAIGFVDTKTINNYAQVILPAAIKPDDTITIAGNDDPVPPVDTGASTDASVEKSQGGGAFGGSAWVLCLVLVLILRRWCYQLQTRRFQLAG